MFRIPSSTPRYAQPASPVGPDWSWIRPKALWLPTLDFPVDVAGTADAMSIGQHVSMDESKLGRCIKCGYSPPTGPTGYFTAPGAVNLTGLSGITLFAVVEFTDIATSGESGIIRCDDNTNPANASYALDVFANTKTIRPLLSTTGISGWVVGNDVVRNEIALLTPLVIITRYQNIPGRQFLDVSVVPIGKAAAWSHAGTVTGTVTQTSGISSSFQTHLGGMAHTGGFNFPGNIYLAGVLPYYLENPDADRLSKYPWEVFAPQESAMWIPIVAGGANSFSYSATGGMQLGGASALIRGSVPAPSGGMQLGGSSAEARGKIAILGGGGAILGGAATQVRGRAIDASGGTILGGAASIVRSAIKAATGGLQLGGAASVSFTSAVQSRVVNAVGGMILAGAAGVQRTVTASLTASGLLFGGSAGAYIGGQIGNWLQLARRRGNR